MFVRSAWSNCWHSPIWAVVVASFSFLGASVGAAEQPAAGTGNYYLQKGDVVLFLGDSITAETKYYWAIFSDDLKQKYPELGTGGVPYKKEEMAAAGIKFINGGVSGDIAAGGLQRLDGLIETHKPSVCVVCFGMNDQFKDLDGYKKNLQGILKKCKQKDIAVTVLTAPCVDTVSKPGLAASVGLLSRLATEAKEVAEQEGALYADCFTPFRKYIEVEKRALSYGDGIHPNDAGHRLMADTLEKAWGFGLMLGKRGDARPSKPPTAVASGGSKSSEFHGGVTWQRLTIAPEVKTCEFIWVHPNTGDVYAFCNKQDVYSSADEGKTWTLLTTDVKSRPTGMVEQVLLDPKDDKRFYATAMYGGGAPYVTADGGRTWQPLGLGACDFLAVDFSDPARKLVLSCLHETANGFRVNRNTASGQPGEWEKIDLKDVSSGAFMHTVDSKTWLLGGMAWGHGRSGVYRTEDAGKSFKLLGDASAAPPTVRCCFQQRGAALLYLSGKGIVISKDQGRNWEVQPTPDQPWTLSFTPGGAWLACERGLYFSGDELKSWQPVASSLNIKDAFFAVHPSGKSMFLSKYDGTLQSGVWEDKPAELIVWSGDLPAGQTWAKLGPKGGFKVEPKAGLGESGRGMVLHMDGEGWRGGGINWKGWYPADSSDDVSRYTALVMHVRQVSEVAAADLTVSLVDNVPRNKGEAAGNPVSLVADGGVQRLDGQWRRVVLPLNLFTHNKSLNLGKLWGVDFSNLGDQPLTFQIDRIGFAVEHVNPPRFKTGPAYAATGRVFPTDKLHAISDGIYGVCGLPREKLIEFRIPITRWGGNSSSRYNWKLGVDNGAHDWYFKNRGELLARLTDSGYVKHIDGNQVFGATTYQTVPMVGWVAKDAGSYGFSVAKYGPQKGSEPGNPDVGNGIRADGKPVTGNDPADTSLPAPPEYIGEAVRFVTRVAGKADGSDGLPGVKYWALDNEPMLWNSTHRDVHPEPLGYDDLWSRTVQYAEAIKKADPTTKVAGFCSWGWTDLYYSAKDAGQDNYQAKPDWQAHGKTPLGEWFIKKCAEYKKEHGKPLIDVFDIHWYPQGQVKNQGAYLGRGLDPELNAYRMRSTRDLWDTKYEQDSWIRNTDNYSPVALIPRVRKWIDAHNPGMELCLGEYNFGGADNVTGGLAQAEVFGVMAQERLDLAFIWHTPAGTQTLAWQLFRSYDGKKSGFGEELVRAESNHPDLSLFAARRKADRALTIVAINKNLHGPNLLTCELGNIRGNLRVWRFDQDSDDKVTEIAEAARAVDGPLKLTLPAASASMLVITPAEVSQKSSK